MHPGWKIKGTQAADCRQNKGEKNRGGNRLAEDAFGMRNVFGANALGSLNRKPIAACCHQAAEQPGGACNQTNGCGGVASHLAHHGTVNILHHGFCNLRKNGRQGEAEDSTQYFFPGGICNIEKLGSGFFHGLHYSRNSTKKGGYPFDESENHYA